MDIEVIQNLKFDFYTNGYLLYPIYLQLSFLGLNFTFLTVKVHQNSFIHCSSFLTLLLLCHPSYSLYFPTLCHLHIL